MGNGALRATPLRRGRCAARGLHTTGGAPSVLAEPAGYARECANKMTRFARAPLRTCQRHGARNAIHAACHVGRQKHGHSPLPHWPLQVKRGTRTCWAEKALMRNSYHMNASGTLESPLSSETLRRGTRSSREERRCNKRFPGRGMYGQMCWMRFPKTAERANSIADWKVFKNKRICTSLWPPPITGNRRAIPQGSPGNSRWQQPRTTRTRARRPWKRRHALEGCANTQDRRGTPYVRCTEGGRREA